MRIAFLTSEYPTKEKPQGGLATYLKKTAKQLVIRGHKVTIFILSNKSKSWKDDGIEIFEIEHNCNTKIISKIPILRIFYWIIFDLIGEKKIEKKIIEENSILPFDILQIPILPYGETLGTFLLKKSRLIPVVCRFSFYPPLYYSINREIKIINYIKHVFTLYKLKNADACFSPCKFMSGKIYSKTKVMPVVLSSPIESIDISKYSKDISNINNKIRYLIFFNQFDYFKGIDLIAEILNPLLNKYKNLTFIFIGKDNGVGLNNNYTAWEDYIKSKCNTTFHDRLIFCPPFSKDKLYPLIKKAEGVLLPSRADNYPNSCLESHMLGTPVIGTYNSSLEEMISDGKTGFLAINSNPASLQEAVEKLLLLNSEQKQEMKNHIFDYVKKIEAEDRIGKLIQFYDSVIYSFKNA